MGRFNLFKPNVEKMEQKKDVNGLVGALRYKEERVREQAIHALVRIGIPAVELLIQALNDGDREVRYCAVWGLGEIGDVRAVEPLIKALKDEFWKIRRNAAQTLGLMKDPRAVEPLIEVLKYDLQGEVRDRAAAALGWIGDAKASEALVQALKDENSSVQGCAATALGEVGDVRAIEPLAQAVKERKFYGQDQLQAERALEKVKARAILELEVTSKDVDGLIMALENQDWAVRMVAANALGQIGDKKAVGPLVKHLKDVDAVAAKAAWALGSMGDEEAVYPLIEAFQRRRTEIRSPIKDALRKFRRDKSLESMEKSKDVTGLVICLALGEAQERATEALVRIGDERAAEPFITILNDMEGDFGDSNIGKCRAAEVLGRMRCKKAVTSLIIELNGEGWRTSDNLRRSSAEALGAIGDERAVEPLIRALKAESELLQRAAADALFSIGEPAVRPLVQALTDEHVRWRAAPILDKMGWKPKNDEEKVYYLIADGRWGDLVNMGEPAVEPLIKTLESLLYEHRHDVAKADVAKALGEIGDSRAVQPLILALREGGVPWRVRDEAAVALAKIGDARAIGPLTHATKDGDPQVRRAAKWALEEIKAKGERGTC